MRHPELLTAQDERRPQRRFAPRHAARRGGEPRVAGPGFSRAHRYEITRPQCTTALQMRFPAAGRTIVGKGPSLARVIEIVGILIAARDGKHASAQYIGKTVRDQQRLTRVGDQRRQWVRDPQTPFRCRQEHHTAVRGNAPAIEGSSDFLAPDGWKTEASERIVLHGGCGSE